MEEEKVEKWEMYMQMQQLLRKGFSKVKIAEMLGISRSTVYRYINRNPQSMAKWMETSKVRQKKLDPYKELILSWLQDYPDMSAAQVLDWLLEKYEGLEIAESTVRNYVRELRKTYDITKGASPRSYEAVAEIPMGIQMQVDFGQTEQRKPNGKTEKLRFIAFVLAHSRYKYMAWLDRPFTTKDVIRSHENAFRFYGGIPNELVYDQDALILVSENGGDLILTQGFQAYREERQLNLHICRKADPESKGKIENVIKYIKQNFAKHRVYHGIHKWNEEALRWLKRTGNDKEHNTIKKRPVDVFSLERQHLRPISNPIEDSFDINNISSITRSVRKDNTVWFKSNRYSVPLGTFNHIKEIIVKTTDNNYLTVIHPETGEILAKHPISAGKGQLIQNTSHLRDRTVGIDAFIEKVASAFSEQAKATEYLQEIRSRRPRYIRDQLQLVYKQVNTYDSLMLDATLAKCLEANLYSATAFIDVIQHLSRDREATVPNKIEIPKQIRPLSETVLQTNVFKRDVQEYVTVLEGDK